MQDLVGKEIKNDTGQWSFAESSVKEGGTDNLFFTIKGLETYPIAKYPCSYTPANHQE